MPLQHPPFLTVALGRPVAILGGGVSGGGVYELLAALEPAERDGVHRTELVLR